MPRLPDGEVGDEGRARPDDWKRHAGHAIVLSWHRQPVAVERTVLIERIDDAQTDVLALAQPDQRRGHSAVDADRLGWTAIDHHHLIRNAQFDIRPRDSRQRVIVSPDTGCAHAGK